MNPECSAQENIFGRSDLGITWAGSEGTVMQAPSSLRNRIPWYWQRRSLPKLVPSESRTDR
jgi:hypothetical protein